MNPFDSGFPCLGGRHPSDERERVPVLILVLGTDDSGLFSSRFRRQTPTTSGTGSSGVSDHLQSEEPVEECGEVPQPHDQDVRDVQAVPSVRDLEVGEYQS